MEIGDGTKPKQTQRRVVGQFDYGNRKGWHGLESEGNIWECKYDLSLCSLRSF
jgi:hypothetical protein